MTSLYHYTDINALMGIVGVSRENSEFWLTNIDFMNDSEEFKVGIDLLKKRISQHVNDDFGDAVTSAAISMMNKRIFVGSFSMNGDQLSQWRGYCSKGGVCIEFDKAKLTKLMKAQAIGEFSSLKPCKYKNHEKLLEAILTLTDRDVKECLSSLEMLDRSDEQGIKKLIDKLFLKVGASISIDLPFLKNSTFHEESEYRISVITPDNRGVKFRSNGEYLIPYIPIVATEEYSVRDCIKGVIIGPSAHQERCVKSVDWFLKSHGVKVRVEASKTPLISW